MPRGPESLGEWELPKLRAAFTLEEPYDIDPEFYDVKFYPYNPPGSPPIFAVISKCNATVARILPIKDHPIEVIRMFAISSPAEARQQTFGIGCCWAKDPETHKPLLCVVGNDSLIRIFDVKEGTLFDTFAGHGDSINDVATNPNDPSMIASAADDTTVRVWSLAAVHKKQPCVALLAGEGHQWNLLTLAWHSTGRYLLSAGHDQVVNMWTVPDIPNKHMEVPIVVHYPHFMTWAIHSNLVDCIEFIGDYILSRSCYEELIVLWRIEGFDSANPPPSPLDAPTAYNPKKITRSAFANNTPASCPAEYTRLLEFDTPGCGQMFFMRFGVFQAPGKHTVLAFCNAKSQAMFWDFTRLTAYDEFMGRLRDPDRDRSIKFGRPPWLPGKAPKNAEKADNPGNRPQILMDQTENESVAASAAATPVPEEGGPALEFAPDVVAHWESMYGVTEKPLKPHKLIPFQKDLQREGKLVGRQCAWSPDGVWCVMTGNGNRALLFQRWAKDKQ